MKHPTPHIYDNVPLAFRVNGSTVAGTLKGTFEQWAFHSQSPFFRAYFPGGVLTSEPCEEEPLPEQEQILDALIEAAEASGYTFSPGEALG